MRAALILSGQPRFFDLGYETLQKNLIDSNPDWTIDTFCHAWWSQEKVGSEYSGSSWNSGKTDTVRDNMHVILKEMYDAKSIKLEPEPEINFKHTSQWYKDRMAPDQDPYILFSMFKTISESYKLYHEYKQLNRINNYHLVIRSRYDINLQDPIDLYSVDSEKMWYSPVLRNPEINWPCDWLNISSSLNMMHYSHSFNYIHHHLDSGIRGCGERIIKAQMQKHGIVFQKAEPKINMELWRNR